MVSISMDYGSDPAQPEIKISLVPRVQPIRLGDTFFCKNQSLSLLEAKNE